MNGSALSLVFKPRFLFNMLAITTKIAESICPMLGNPRQSSILDSGFHTVDPRFQLLDSNLCQWKLDSGSQNLRDSRFLELYSGFQNPGLRIPQASFPDSGFHKQKFLAFLHFLQKFLAFHNFLMFRWMKQSVDRSKINEKMNKY